MSAALSVKIYFMAISVLNTVFSYMVVRQVSLMNESFKTSLHGFFTFLAWVHFFAAVFVTIVVFTAL